jgi:hypothetical protein
MGSISLLLIEKTMPGVECRRMDCMGRGVTHFRVSDCLHGP